eukprot:4877765-Pleurochrysis_carterae.AAC.1
MSWLAAHIAHFRLVVGIISDACALQLVTDLIGRSFGGIVWEIPVRCTATAVALGSELARGGDRSVRRIRSYGARKPPPRGIESRSTDGQHRYVGRG